MNQNVLLEDSWYKKGGKYNQIAMKLTLILNLAALPPTYEETFRLSASTDSSSDEE